MNELEVQAYINGWDDAIKHILYAIDSSKDISVLRQHVYDDLYYKDKHYGSLSHKDNLKS